MYPYPVNYNKIMRKADVVTDVFVIVLIFQIQLFSAFVLTLNFIRIHKYFFKVQQHILIDSRPIRYIIFYI